MPAAHRLVIRSARPHDHPAIVTVLDQWWGGRAMAEKLPRLFLEQFASTSLVAESDDGSLVGFVIGFVSPDVAGTAYLHFAGVAPEHRRSGLGTELYQSFFALVRAAGCFRVRAVTSPVNETSQAFHRALGFAVSEPVPDYDGPGADRVVMTYDLLTETGQSRTGGPPELPVFCSPADSRPDDAPWPAAAWPPAPDVVLRGERVELRPSRLEDAAELFEALDDDRVWAHLRGRPTEPAGWRDMLAGAASVGRFPWTVRLAEPYARLAPGVVVGTTSYLEVSPGDARLEIGWTAYAQPVWGSAVNPEAKLLLLGYAFDDLGMGRVQLKTDIRNVRSQQAIARLGARHEGVLRRYQRRADDTVRDTVLFSITAEEWPEVRDRLRKRLAAGD